MDRIKNTLKQEINKEDWNNFIKKIEYCKNIKYTSINY